MKKYHEIATVKDGNKIVGFLISENSPENRVSYGKYRRIDYTDIETMKHLCADNLMDYLIYNKDLDRLEVCYTDDDISMMKQLGISTKFIKKTSTISEYIKNDVRLNAKFMNYYGHILIGIPMVMMKVPILGPIVTMMVLGDMNVVNNWLATIQNDVIYKSFKEIYDVYDNNGVIVFPLNYMNFLSNLDIIIDVTTLYKDKASCSIKNGFNKMVMSTMEVTVDDKIVQPLKDKTKQVAFKYGFSI